MTPNIADLEPLAGACLAVSLAYLTLERFRHRSKIRRHAREKLNTLDATALSPAAQGLKWFKHIHQLADLEDNDLEINGSAQLMFNFAPQNGTNKDAMRELWWKIYCVLFRNHFDRVSVYVCALYSMILLVFGVAEKIGSWVGLVDTLKFIPTWVLFNLLSLTFIIPLILVMCGSFLVRSATQSIDETIAEMEGFLKRQAQEATAPTLPPGALT